MFIWMFIWLFQCAISGVLVPGGFGVRGTEGKIQAINWARKRKKPFLGNKFYSENWQSYLVLFWQRACGSIWNQSKSHLAGVCLGMQLAVCEFARNVLGWEGKNTPIPDFMISLSNQTSHMLLKCFYLNFIPLNRCQFNRIWPWNKTSSGR